MRGRNYLTLYIIQEKLEYENLKKFIDQMNIRNLLNYY